MNEEELKKGCGKDLKRKVFEGDTDMYCGIEIFVSEKVGLKTIYCSTCQARLEGFQKGKQEALNLIENRIVGYEELRDESLCSKRNIIIEIIKELKELSKEIGGKK